jgi:hypothetical protein
VSNHCCKSIFITTAELLELISIHGMATGEDIFCMTDTSLKMYKLSFNKCPYILTDVTPAMTDIKNDLITTY